MVTSMTLPLFPDPPSSLVTNRSSVRPARVPKPEALPPLMPAVSAQPAPAAPAPLSIRDVAGLIQDQLRPLAMAGRRIVHAQWIKPGINAGARGFLSVTLADSQDTNVSIDGFIWERADVQAVLQQGKAFGCDLADREG